ncbi:MAG: histidinol-phosphate transaminase [Firmicutes bacterium]|nr:histidinol-phosphate transaminase [Bacillota bacterium]
MSRFFSKKYKDLEPYTPGEQPKERKFIKLNTNESPYAPSKVAIEFAKEALERLQLYPDPECTALTAELSSLYGVEPDQILWTNGSDDILNFAFMAFCDESHPAAFPEISYGFYQVFAQANGVPFKKIPLKEDLSVCAEDYYDLGHTIFIANPNAPTGKALSPAEIEKILRRNPDSVVVIDEAYVDFGAESCVPLVAKYENLLVTQTFSKSRSMAGARLGFCIGCQALISDLNTLKYSTNPYNINSVTMAAGIGTLKDDAYIKDNCRRIAETRDYTTMELRALGFETTDSVANFMFISHPKISGAELYARLRELGILVRYFSAPKISRFVRVTVGSREEMTSFLEAVKLILEE